ncbi:response regulator [Methylovirgula sp. HY1]|uniref:response regulator n=1 Tax=Methylovirgula sp. HY1 TaxID=2822761 RepID=UPI001C5BCBD5|nr:response regulator [Methylovirgula sp. HY1]QXX75390.1 Chemotaxis protein CheY [Methylovirgula sp. HY1]
MPAASAIRALIVDDQLTSRALIRDGLQQLGIQDIEMAADGEQGLKVMMQKPAHLIISDLNMPKLDGLGFLRAVRANPPTKNAAFIMLTGRGDREFIEKAVKCGVNNYLVKPFTMPSLRGAIEAVLGRLK